MKLRKILVIATLTAIMSISQISVYAYENPVNTPDNVVGAITENDAGNGQDSTPTPIVTPSPTPQPTPSPTPQPTPSPTPVPEKYSVKFMQTDGTVLQDQTIENGQTAQRPANPQLEGHDFIGWYCVDSAGNLQTEFSFSDPITKQMLVYAKFSPSKYKISYVLPDGASNNNPNEYEYGQGVAKFNDPQLEEYTFDGWYSDSEYNNKVTMISNDYAGDLTLYAKFNKKTYKVEYVLDGGTNDQRNPTSYTFGEYYKIYPATKEGYTFGGWFENPDFTQQRTSVDVENKQDFKLYAKWIANSYNINYVLAGGNLPDGAVRTYKQGEGVQELPIPTKTGYTFDGWYSDESKQTKITGISKEQSGDITVYASWTAGAIQITYNLNGGTNNPENPNSYKVNSGKVTLLDPTRENYRFLGWFSDKELTKQVYFIDGSSENLTLYAKWEYVGDSGQSSGSGGDSSSQSAASDENSETSEDQKEDNSIGPVVILLVVWVIALLILGAVWIIFIVKQNRADDSDDDYDDSDDNPDDNSDDDDFEDYSNDTNYDFNGSDVEVSGESDKSWMNDVNLSDIVNSNKNKLESVQNGSSTRAVDRNSEIAEIDSLLDDLNGKNKS